MVLYGAVFYFVLIYSWKRNKSGNKLTWKRYWFEEKDDFLVVLLVGFAMIIWDDEMLEMYNDYVENDIEEIKSWMYFLPGPLANFLYKIITGFRKNEKG